MRSSSGRRLLFVVTEDFYFLSHRLALARRAREAGWQVGVATGPGEKAAAIASEGFEHFVLDLERGSTHPVLELRALASVVEVMRAYRPDVVHLVAVKPIVYGSIASRLLGVQGTLCAVAGLGFLYLGGGAKRRAMRAFVETVYKTCVRGRPGVRVLVQNADDRAVLIDGGMVEPEQVDVVPGSGVDLDRFACPPPAAHDVVEILTHSRMLWDKGIGELVEAARMLKARGTPCRVTLVGDPDPHNPASIDRPTLEAWASEGVVQWLGRRDDIPRLLCACDIACLPSYREGMPLSLLEAAAAGRPIVTTDVPGCRDVVEDGVSGILVPARDAHGLAQALERLVTDAALRARMGGEARRRAETRFGKRAIDGAIVEIYERLV